MRLLRIPQAQAVITSFDSLIKLSSRITREVRFSSFVAASDRFRIATRTAVWVRSSAARHNSWYRAGRQPRNDEIYVYSWQFTWTEDTISLFFTFHGNFSTQLLWSGEIFFEVTQTLESRKWTHYSTVSMKIILFSIKHPFVDSSTCTCVLYFRFSALGENCSYD